MTNMENIKIGDRVKCINDEASFGKLQNGNTYIAEKNYDGSATVIIRGSAHNLDRFEKAVLSKYVNSQLV